MSNDTTPPVPIPTDAILTITTGNPNDYCVMGVFRAKQEIDYAACYRAYVQEHPNQGTPAGHRLGFKPSEFLGWLARLGLLEAIDCFEWNIEWGCIEGACKSWPLIPRRQSRQAGCTYAKGLPRSLCATA